MKKNLFASAAILLCGLGCYAQQCVINTDSICADAQGYKGPVPVIIYISGNTVDSIRPLSNIETPRFFSRVTREYENRWDNVTVAEAIGLEVDAVSGATFSSEAYLRSVRAGLSYYAEKHPDSLKSNKTPYVVSAIVTLLAAAGGIVAIARRKKQKHSFS